MRIVTIPLPIYRCHVVAYFGGDRKEAFTRFTKRCRLPVTEWPEPKGGTDATTLQLEETKDAAIWFRRRKPKPEIIAHEAFHATSHILRFAGVDDEEAAAYLLDYLVSQIHFGMKV